MTTIVRTPYTNGIAGNPYPILYVDTPNMDGITAEMNAIFFKHIREATPKNKEAPLVFIRDTFLAKSEDEIYRTKTDGFWLIVDSKTNSATLYKRTTSVGYIYSSVYVEKQFALTCVQCPRVVPKVFPQKTTTLFDDFSSELKDRVNDYINRGSSGANSGVNSGLQNLRSTTPLIKRV